MIPVFVVFFSSQQDSTGSIPPSSHDSVERAADNTHVALPTLCATEPLAILIEPVTTLLALLRCRLRVSNF